MASARLFLLAAVASTSTFGIVVAEDAGPRIKECRVGFGDVYKVGHWTPVWVTVDRVGSRKDLVVEVTANDNDGIPATAFTPVPTSPSPGESSQALLYTQVGRMGSRLVVSLVSDGVVVDRMEPSSGTAPSGALVLTDLPATSELLVALGAAPFGLEQALPPRDSSGADIVRRAVRLDDIRELPLDWMGYDAVDVLVLSVGDGTLCQQLAADTRRMSALRRWVELGGRLVILCEGQPAEQLLATGQPFAALVPGKFTEIVQLSQTGPLEHFADGSPLIAAEGTRVELNVPKLTEVTGQIEAFAGQQPSDLPLVVRGPLGLGEVALAGVNLAAPPLATWRGRTAFLRALLHPYTARTEGREGPQSLMTLGYNDVSGALRQRLGSSFQGVTTMKFPAVASLALAYLLLLGPLDYWLVHKFIRRPGAGWITFPVLVFATCAGAYAVGSWAKGTGSQRVNQLELVDFDLTTGLARGTYWAALYSPQSRRYNLGLASKSAESSAESSETLLSSWGLTGAGIGGMDARTGSLATIPTGYRYSRELDELWGVPLLTSSTKSLLGRWSAPAPPVIEASLTDQDQLAVGSLVNRSGQSLRNVRLLYGSWAYQLGQLSDNERIDVGPHLNPLLVKTLVARSAGIAADRLSGETARVLFLADRATTEELLNLMMFFAAGGGEAFAQLPSRYQSYCDLSRLLQLGRAILVAEAPSPRSTLADATNDKPLAQAGDATTVVYRFVLPVERK